MYIDFKKMFGKDYNVVCDENYEYEEEGKFMQLRITGWNGQHLYPGYAKDLFGVLVKGKKNIAQCLAWGFVSTQICDNEATFGFPLEYFAQVAKLIKANKRRRLNPEHRAKFVEQGKKNLAKVNLKRKETQTNKGF